MLAASPTTAVGMATPMRVPCTQPPPSKQVPACENFTIGTRAIFSHRPQVPIRERAKHPIPTRTLSACFPSSQPAAWPGSYTRFVDNDDVLWVRLELSVELGFGFCWVRVSFSFF